MTRYVVVDVETTGNQFRGKDRIIQFAAVVVQNEKIVDRYTTFINPNRTIPEFITELTGITNETVQQAPTFAEVAEDIYALLNENVFVAHNVQFDHRFLDHEIREALNRPLKVKQIDTVELCRVFYPTLSSYRLQDVATQFQFDHLRPHQADSDAEVTAEVLIKILRKMKRLPLEIIQRLTSLSTQWKSEITSHFLELEMNKLKKAEKKEQNVDYYRGLVLKKVQVEFDFSDAEADMHHCVQHILRNEEKMKCVFPHYVVREEQIQMIESVYDSLLQRKKLLLEAPTGLGKTLGYLFPALVYSRKYDVPIIVSTETIQQQQQIHERDIPLLRKILPFNFFVTVMKGSQHYLCLNKFEQSLYESENNYDSSVSKAQILIWLMETKTGDKDELNLSSGGQILWNRVASDGDRTDRERNPWDEKCFYQRAKSQLMIADLIITNHSYLVHEIKRKSRFILDAGGIIVDEAHQLERVASSQLGTSMSFASFQKWFSRLGYIDQEEAVGKIYRFCKHNIPALQRQLRQLDERLRTIRYETEECFKYIREWVDAKGELSQDIKKEIIVKEWHRRSKEWENISLFIERIQARKKEVVALLTYIDDELEKNKFQWGFSMAHAKRELHYAREECNEWGTDLNDLFSHSGYVIWIQMDPKGSYHHLWIRRQKVNVAKDLAEKLFYLPIGTVLTSGTLTAKGDFTYIVSSLGLQEVPHEKQIVSAPYGLEDKVELYIQTDLPSIKDSDLETFTPKLARSIYELAKVTKGRMLVLFTSYELLKETYNEFKRHNESDDFVVLGQGITSGSVQKLTKNFKTLDNAILFGTSSFWEGVDIPGEDLVCLCIVRLPFVPPDQPVFQEKAKEIKRRGANPFTELSLPEAIIRFRQGFGRLIRKEDDYGTVVVFDTRILSAYYGRFFLESIPFVPQKSGTLEEIQGNMKRFLKHHEGKRRNS